MTTPKLQSPVYYLFPQAFPVNSGVRLMGEKSWHTCDQCFELQSVFFRVISTKPFSKAEWSQMGCCRAAHHDMFCLFVCRKGGRNWIGFFIRQSALLIHQIVYSPWQNSFSLYKMLLTKLDNPSDKWCQSRWCLMIKCCSRQLFSDSKLW